jgi:tetratricopeptide (TPR) repeat protein
MGALQVRGLRCVLIGAVAAFAAAGTARANCTGPADLTAKLHAHPTTENAVELGGWFASHKQFECAVETFRTALKTDRQSAQLYYLEGLALIGGGHPADALPALQQSERLDPDVIKPHLMLAYTYDKAEQLDKAEDEWRLALKIDSHSELALEGLSADLLAEQDYLDVIGLLRNAPRTEKLAINLAKAFGLLNYLDEAKSVLADALKLSPNSVPLASAMAVVLVKQTHFQEAVNQMQKTVHANPGNQDAEVELFRLLVLTNRIGLAQPMGPKLLAERPHDPEVIYLNGVVERSVGEYAKAKAHLEEAVALDPNFFNSRYNLGKVLVILQQWAEAKEQLEKAITLGSIEPQVHYELAMALRGLGERERADEEVKKYQDGRRVEEADLEASFSAAQADQDMAAGDVKDAITEYRSAVGTAPENAGYEFKLALALHQAGETESERAALEQAVKLNPELAGAQKELGYLLSRSGDQAGAVEHFRMAVKAQPGWAEAWINLAAALAETGQFGEARKAAAAALRVDPKNAQAKELSDELARDPAAQQATP